MTWNYAYTPAIWPSFLSVILLIALGIFSERRRSVPGALPLAFGCLFAALVVAGSILETAALDLQTKIFWFKFQGFFQLPSITAITCFVLDYAWPGRWLTRRNLVLLVIPCLLILVLISTDNIHHRVWSGFEYDEAIIPIRGPVNWLFVLYGYGLTFFNLIVLFWLFLRSPKHRWPVAIMLIGLLGASTLYLLEAFQTLPTGLPFNIPPVAFEYLMYAIALFGFHILDPIPLARRMAIDQLRAGMLVLDTTDKIISLNHAAADIFGSPSKRLLGRPIQELLPTCSDLAGCLQQDKTGYIEVSLGKGAETLFYQCEASVLKDWRGLAVGRLVLLQDVTEQKRAQAQLLDQQRALAMLHEREQLARELHDGLGQVLGYTKLQAQAARDLLAQDHKAEADSNLAQLMSVVQDAHDDVREYLLGAKTTAHADSDFIGALRKYLEAFSEQYRLRTELTAPPEWSNNLLEPTAIAQLMRIIQESLTNARKHAQARRVQVQIQLTDSVVQVIVQDDGAGFDPSRLPNGQGQKYGLGFMRQRAQEAGGRLELISQPGQGTKVVVEMPAKIDTGTGRRGEEEKRRQGEGKRV